MFRDYLSVQKKPDDFICEQIDNLIKRIENLTYKFGYEMTFITCKNIMLGNLRRILNSKLSALDPGNKVICLIKLDDTMLYNSYNDLGL